MLTDVKVSGGGEGQNRTVDTTIFSRPEALSPASPVSPFVTFPQQIRELSSRGHSGILPLLDPITPSFSARSTPLVVQLLRRLFICRHGHAYLWKRTRGGEWIECCGCLSVRLIPPVVRSLHA